MGLYIRSKARGPPTTVAKQGFGPKSARVMLKRPIGAEFGSFTYEGCENGQKRCLQSQGHHFLTPAASNHGDVNLFERSFELALRSAATTLPYHPQVSMMNKIDGGFRPPELGTREGGEECMGPFLYGAYEYFPTQTLPAWQFPMVKPANNGRAVGYGQQFDDCKEAEPQYSAKVGQVEQSEDSNWSTNIQKARLESVQRRARSQEKNRIAAMKSRQRKKKELERLVESEKNLKKENQALYEKIKQLEKELSQSRES